MRRLAQVFARFPAVEFYHVRFADQAQSQRAQEEAAGDAHVSPGLGTLFVDALVQLLALHRAAIFAPLLLDVNQRALPLAEEQVLQGG